MKIRRLSRRVLMAGLAVAASGVGLSLNAAPAGAVTFTNACINSAVPTNFSEIDVTLTGSAPASVPPGTQFQLTNINLTTALPGAIFVAGYNLGLLQVGQNTIPGTVAATIEGTNTVEGTQNTPAMPVSATFTITDPDGSPGTGDETGTDASVTVNYPNQTWTAGPAGAIEFREDTVTPQSSTVAGIRIITTIGGFLTVRFGCNPGTVGSGPPEFINLIDPAVSFASTVSGTTQSTTTSSTTTSTTSTTTLPVENKCAGAKLKAAGKKAACLLGVNAKAAKSGDPVDAEKVQGCKDKFSSAFAKAEAKPPCLTMADTTDIENKVDMLVADVTGEIDVAPAPSKCQARKLKAAGKKAKCLLGLESKEAAKAKPKDPDKVLGCKDKFSSAFAKAEEGTDCGAATGDASDIEDRVDLFVDDVDGELVP